MKESGHEKNNCHINDYNRWGNAGGWAGQRKIDQEVSNMAAGLHRSAMKFLVRLCRNR